MPLMQIAHEYNPWWRNAAARSARHLPLRRALQERVRTQIASTDRRAVVITGPRQVGKTTLLRQTADDLLDEGWLASNVMYFDLSDERIIALRPSPREVVAIQPEGFDRERPRAVILDEIGQLDGWAAWLKSAVDAGLGKILVTDSSASLLRKGGRESGEGRWDEHRLESLTYWEFLALQSSDGDVARTEVRLGQPFERFLRCGGYPEHLMADDFAVVRDRIRKAAIERSILRDQLDSGLDLARLCDVFVYLVESSGAVFDRRKIGDALASELGSGRVRLDPRTVDRYLDALCETMLVSRLSPFGRSHMARLRQSGMPKVYAANHGLTLAFAHGTAPTRDPVSRGRALEAAVFAQLRSLADIELSYFRAPKGEAEIDFVVRSQAGLHAVEVTEGDDLRRKLAPLRQAAAELKADRVWLVHGGGQSEEIGSVRIVPVARFLLEGVKDIAS